MKCEVKLRYGNGAFMANGWVIDFLMGGSFMTQFKLLLRLKLDVANSTISLPQCIVNNITQLEI